MNAVTDQQFPGITQNKTPCWVITDPAGEERHYDEETGARTGLSQRAGDGVTYTLTVRDEPCWMAVALCGYVYDEDGECAEHWPAPPDAFDRHLMSVEWRRGPNGELLCPEYSTCECDSLAAARAGVTL